MQCQCVTDLRYHKFDRLPESTCLNGKYSKTTGRFVRGLPGNYSLSAGNKGQGVVSRGLTGLSEITAHSATSSVCIIHDQRGNTCLDITIGF